MTPYESLSIGGKVGRLTAQAKITLTEALAELHRTLEDPSTHEGSKHYARETVERIRSALDTLEFTI